MYYDVAEANSARVVFTTHPKARRGRGVLFATLPAVVYLLALCALFVLSVQDLSLWTEAKSAAKLGAFIAAGLTAACFLLGRRIHDRIEATRETIKILHTPALGAARTEEIRCAELSGLAVDASLRSLGADVLLVAVTRDGKRIPIAEGEPHSGQVRELAARIAGLTNLPLEAPRFTTH
jgi:hypothetical protein